MDSKEYTRLVVDLKERFAQMPEFSRLMSSWLKEKDRKFVEELARLPTAPDQDWVANQAGRAAQRLELRQTFFKESNNG